MRTPSWKPSDSFRLRRSDRVSSCLAHGRVVMLALIVISISWSLSQLVGDRFEEMIRLSKLLGERLIPADVVVISQKAFDQWRGVPNTLAWHASREGRLYESVA